MTAHASSPETHTWSWRQRCCRGCCCRRTRARGGCRTCCSRSCCRRCRRRTTLAWRCRRPCCRARGCLTMMMTVMMMRSREEKNNNKKRLKRNTRTHARTRCLRARQTHTLSLSHIHTAKRVLMAEIPPATAGRHQHTQTPGELTPDASWRLEGEKRLYSLNGRKNEPHFSTIVVLVSCASTLSLVHGSG